jgi:hypothetical protein
VVWLGLPGVSNSNLSSKLITMILNGQSLSIEIHNIYLNQITHHRMLDKCSIPH